MSESPPKIPRLSSPETDQKDNDDDDKSSIYPYNEKGDLLFERKDPGTKARTALKQVKRAASNYPKPLSGENRAETRIRDEEAPPPPQKKVMLDMTGSPEDILEYSIDVYVWKKKLEEKYRAPNCLLHQRSVTPENRQNILRWLAELYRSFEFNLETWCLTVNILDRFFSSGHQVELHLLQLAGLTSFFIASKLEEVDPLKISELVTLCGRRYEPQTFLWMERVLLTYSGFNLMAPTTAFFLSQLVEVERMTEIWPDWLSGYIIERVNCDYKLSQLPPSFVAQAIFSVLSFDSSDPRLSVKQLPSAEIVDEYFRLIVSALTKD